MAAASVVPLPPAAAQRGDESALRIVVPLAPGGATDVVARLLAESLRRDLARPAVIDNRPGATGRIAVDVLKSAPADGSTFLLTPIALPVIVPLVLNDVRYDVARDLAPVAGITVFEYGLAVADDHPARTLDEFVAWSRANPARATFGTPGPGSGPHLIGTLFAKTSGVALLHVPYRSAAAVDVDVVGGRVAAHVGSVPDLVGGYRSGRIRVLATTGAKRSPVMSDVPTFAESGYAVVEATGWHALFAPAGTSPAMVARLSEVVSAALRAPDTRERLRAIGLEPAYETPSELTARIETDIARWRRIVKLSGFAPE